MDGQKLAENIDSHAEDWFYYDILRNGPFMAIMTFNMGTHMYYDGQHVHIEVPRMDVPFYGECMKR